MDITNKRCELFAIGNELLVGQVLDTNSHWLIRNLTAIGAQVMRAGMVRDDFDLIGSEITSALRRAPRLIITTGGLGPTDDDLTLRALSRALNLPLVEDPTALEMVRARYEHIASIRPGYSAELNEARRKMALLPQGATPLKNNNGAAPGVVLDLGDTTLVNLPGVPSEMRDIFGTSMQVVLERTVGKGGYVERVIVLDRGDESRIAALLMDTQDSHPSVYIKSRGQTLPMHGLRLTVVLSCGGSDIAQVKSQVTQAEAELIAGLQSLGYAILDVLDA